MGFFFSKAFIAKDNYIKKKNSSWIPFQLSLIAQISSNNNL